MTRLTRFIHSQLPPQYSNGDGEPLQREAEEAAQRIERALLAAVASGNLEAFGVAESDLRQYERLRYRFPTSTALIDALWAASVSVTQPLGGCCAHLLAGLLADAKRVPRGLQLPWRPLYDALWYALKPGFPVSHCDSATTGFLLSVCCGSTR